MRHGLFLTQGQKA